MNRIGRRTAIAMTFIACAAIIMALTGCMTREERMAAQNAKDDAQCLSYGAKAGTDAYITCRTQLSTAKTGADAIRSSGGPVVCNQVGTTTICN
jgi:hypothetical protein